MPTRTVFFSKEIMVLAILLLTSHLSMGQDTFIDTFSSTSYSNNDGTQNFSNNWTEVSDDADPDNGRIEINGNRLEFNNLDGRTISRDLDLSSYTIAFLSLDFDASSRGNESLLVQLWNNGSSAYETIATINTTTTGSITHTLTANQITASSSIRFVGGDNAWNTSETIYIDNIQIAAGTTSNCTTQLSSPGSAIPDNGATTLNETVSIPTTGIITDVNITLNITHPWSGDLDMFLISPSGTTVELSTDNVEAFGAPNFTNTVFDDAAGTDITAGTAPFTGSFRPEGNLSDFNGEDSNGTWTLSIFDDFVTDAGTLDNFSIEICTLALSSADLAVSKTVSDNTPKENESITYTLSVTNNGPNDATNVSLTDVLPAGVSYVSDDGSYNSGTGVWTIGSITNGATATLNITATVNSGTVGSTITNTITALTADQPDINATADDLSESIVPTADQPPTIVVTGNQVYCAGTSLPIAETISITDPDDTSTDAIFIQISSGYVNGEDLLTLTGTHPSITDSWDPVEGELTLQGPATFAEFEAAILAVEYSSSTAIPTGTRQFSITPGTANFLPPTSHYYEFVSSPNITWTDARDAAALRTYFGLQGYLATLTTQAEADFSGQQAQGVGWIGGSDAATEGDWRWVTGPEGLANGGTGTPFWSGASGGATTAPDFFAFWNSGEPNNVGDEDYAHITDVSVTTTPGSWNDLPNTTATSGPYQAQGYVVEYGGTAGDPVLNITGVTDITIDNVAPTASNPSPVTVFCTAEVPVDDVNVVTDEADNCTASPTVTFVGDVSDGGTNPEIITRTYRITDASGNTTDVTQTITVDPISVDTQPTNQIVSIGNNGTFSTSTSNADTLQWQVSTNGGSSFTNISDGAQYTGTTTQNLTVLSVSLTQNGHIFRLLISNSTTTCAQVISNEATLIVSIDDDNDGIDNAADLDDDNDGILDSQESPMTVLWVAELDNITTEEQNTIDKLTALGYSVTLADDDVNVGIDANNFAVTFVYEDVFSSDAFANIANLATTTNGVIISEVALHDEIFGATAGGNSNTPFVDIIDNTHPITTGLALGNYDIGNARGHTNSLTTGTVLGRNSSNSEPSLVIWNEGDALQAALSPSGLTTAPGKRAIVPHANDGGNFNGAGEDLLVNVIVWAAAIDTDGDGIYDNLDLDSDNDGIYDVVEAGHDQAQTNGRITGAVGTDGVPDAVQASGQENSGTINYTLANSDSTGDFDYIVLDSDGDGCNDALEAGYTDADADDLLGSSPVTVDGNGVVTGQGGYTIPLDGDSNTVFDFREAGLAPAITVQPTDQISFASNSPTFSVTASNSNTFQWEVSTDGGLNFNPISDGTQYSGTQTASLTVNNVDINLSGYQYRVQISNSSFICSSSTSNTATLTVRIGTVITNRKITFRVNRN